MKREKDRGERLKEKGTALPAPTSPEKTGGLQTTLRSIIVSMNRWIKLFP